MMDCIKAYFRHKTNVAVPDSHLLVSPFSMRRRKMPEFLNNYTKHYKK